MEPSIFIPCYNEQSASLIRVEFPGGHQSDHLEKKPVSLRSRQRVSRSSGPIGLTLAGGLLVAVPGGMLLNEWLGPDLIC